MAQIKGLDSNIYWPDKTKQQQPLKQDAKVNRPENGPVAAPSDNKKLDQKDFFSLLTQQLAYQDPSKPVDNAHMISQMSSFQTSDGIAKLTEEFKGLNNLMTSSKALQASTLVGRSVLVPLDHGMNEGKGFSGVAVAGKGATDVSVTIKDAAGEVIKTINLGDGHGNMKFSWDGKDKTGKAAPEGKYEIEVTGKQGAKNVQLAAATFGHVSSVSLSHKGAEGIKLNLAGLGGFNMKDVLEVGES
ncbi:flagellar hook assembly protein FlgD [Celerinatantimonas sp. MCCC 1A17872]|uniref:flagellar hook assembly protein FlgD n=1 Tax=Celerinatantimonas sp. MCCC 1A17872 TaxID=3177514 RepID=UPI0038C7708F